MLGSLPFPKPIPPRAPTFCSQGFLPVFFQELPMASCLRTSVPFDKIRGGESTMKHSLFFIFAMLLSQSVLFAQTSPPETAAAKIIQPSPAAAADATSQAVGLQIPAGTPIEVEVAYTVNSLDVKSGERISFRVLVPIIVEGVTVIERDALVTARITQAKRGGHWGRAGKLVWSMEDVVAADHSRIPLAH